MKNSPGHQCFLKASHTSVCTSCINMHLHFRCKKTFSKSKQTAKIKYILTKPLMLLKQGNCLHNMGCSQYRLYPTKNKFTGNWVVALQIKTTGIVDMNFLTSTAFPH